MIVTSQVLTSGVILDVPNWLRVWYDRGAADPGSGWSLFVYVSVMVSPRRSLFKPVREIIEGFQATLVHDETVSDPMVMGLSAHLREYRIAGPCPWPAEGIPSRREEAG